MKVQQICQTEYRLEMSDEEFLHFQIIVTGALNEFVKDVPSLINYILTYAEQHWHDTIPEPPTLPLNEG